ncbi:MAG: hypothetical protein RSD27_00535 [Ruthenibacterium sp.]
MKQCVNCGAVLPEGEQSVCLVCGAKQTPSAETYTSPHSAGRERKKKVQRTLRILCIALAALFLLLVIGAGVTYFLYERFNPDRAYSTLSTALLSGDTEALHTLVEGDGVAVSDAGLSALCRAFSTQESVDALLAQLRAQATGAPGDVWYPALSPTSDTVFLGYKQYKILAKPVSLRIAHVADNILLTVDGIARTGDADGDGTLYLNFFPGVYSCVVSGQTALGESVTGESTELALFNAEAPFVFDGALPIADLTIGGCISDDAIISVNGTAATQKPIGHTVTLPQVTVGSTITMSYTTAYGAVTTASVQFTDRTVTALSFAGHVTTGGVPAQADLESIAGAFYASYLDALNNKDAARITTCTEPLREKLKGDVGKKENDALTFLFGKAHADAAHVEQGYIDETTPTLRLNVHFTYTVNKHKEKEKEKEKEKSETDSSVSYTMELVYADGGWKVNRLAENTKENFDAGTLVPIEG